MADGFDECHKKGLSASHVYATPSLARVPHEGAAQKGVSQECTMCFFKYLHPSDLDVNHADLLTSLLIVCCFFPSFFSAVWFFSPSAFPTAVGVQVCACFFPAWVLVCVSLLCLY